MTRHYILRGWAVSLFASLVLCSPAAAQIALGAEVGADRFWGGSIERGGLQRSFRPYRPTAFGVNVERRVGKFALGLRLRYSSAGLALEGAEGASTAHGVFSIYTVSPEIVYRLAMLGSLSRLEVHAGPLFEVWSIVDEGSESRVGVQGGLSVSVPLGGRLEGSLTAGVALIPSPFAPDQLEVNFERRALWRRRVAAGVEYRL